jgi:hypothetical protein
MSDPRNPISGPPDDATRIDVQQPFDVAAPTEALPTVKPRPDHTTPYNTTPYNRDVRVSAPKEHTEGARFPDNEAAEFIGKVFDQQHELNKDAASARNRRFGGAKERNAAPRTVREVAQERSRRTEAAHAKHLRHQAHMDAIEAAQAYVKLAVLVVLFVTMVLVGFYCFQIGTGAYTWGPIKT